MTTADGTLAVTLNGEIYNFRELRQDLDDYLHLVMSRRHAQLSEMYGSSSLATHCRFRGRESPRSPRLIGVQGSDLIVLDECLRQLDKPHPGCS